MLLKKITRWNKTTLIFILLFCTISVLSAQTQTEKYKKTYSQVLADINQNFAEFYLDLQLLLVSVPEDLLILVDKKHLLVHDYVPENLVALNVPRSYGISRHDMTLTAEAENALEKMAKAAKAEGVILIASSGYRSYDYQQEVFARHCKNSGKEAALKFSARPGASQHQLGTAVDFGSIRNSYADTKAGKWLKKNASKYGWSLSYPKGYETITGYQWECWHFRYMGVEACRFQDKWFDGIQQYMLEYIHSRQ
ncbi:MAG: peptidase M15 [Treponema sp.]|nr:MAG: peptidase M15 [Treponema sp.]